MALLKDSLITGDLRVTGTIYGNATSATALKDKTNNTLTYSNYGAAGLAGSSISWMTCWNGYELRAISKAETFNLVRDNGGNSTWVNVSGDTMTGTLNMTPASGEGGEIHLNASTANTTQAGIALDQLNSQFRIFGLASADGTTKTGSGTPLVIDPYAKTITGGYTLTGALTGHASLDLPLTGGILTGGLEIKGHIAGDAGSSGHGLWGGGGYHNAYNNIILHGDASTGTSGIAFISDKGNTTINQPSDRAFIQWHAHGVTTYTAESTNPTLATSGEANILVIGVGNDATDQIRLQSPAVNGLLHQVGASAYVIPSLNETTTTANHPLISTTTAGLYTNNTSITMNGDTITATTFNGNASTATTLQTTRTINGTNFNGSANITTANWGTARNISIADSDGTNTGSAVSVNGSANATLKLPATIKATLTGHASLDLPLAGGTMTGQIKSTKAGGSWIQGRNNACLYQTLTTSNNWHPVVGFKTPSGSWTIGNVGDNENCVFSYDTDTNFNANTNTTIQTLYFDSNGYIHANRVYNAVWNDYAEYRTYNDGETPYGRVICENGDDSVSISTKRLQPGAMICSDTFGTSMGEAENTIPVAVAGRVLAYPLEPKEEYNFFIGQAVCAGPNGTVSIMTKDEVKEYPEAVVGYISAVPQYEEWGTGKVKVDGRVWIKVK